MILLQNWSTKGSDTHFIIKQQKQQKIGTTPSSLLLPSYYCADWCLLKLDDLILLQNWSTKGSDTLYHKGPSLYYVRTLGWMGGPENGNFPLLYVVKMSLHRWVGGSKKAQNTLT